MTPFLIAVTLVGTALTIRALAFGGVGMVSIAVVDSGRKTS